MLLMDKIYLQGELVAVHVRAIPDAKTAAVTESDGALQLLTMKREKGDTVKAHRHVPKKRVTEMLQECLIVVRGKVQYDLFDEAGACFKKVVVGEGEAMLILGVSHAVHFLEKSLVYELKNGPFMDDKKLL